MSQTPDPSDKLGVDNFKGTISHRAGYHADPLAVAMHWARKGGTLQAGEGLMLVREIDRLCLVLDERHRLLHKAHMALGKKLDAPHEFAMVESVRKQIGLTLDEIYGDMSWELL